MDRNYFQISLECNGHTLGSLTFASSLTYSGKKWSKIEVDWLSCLALPCLVLPCLVLPCLSRGFRVPHLTVIQNICYSLKT